jgi:hypothetical protein
MPVAVSLNFDKGKTGSAIASVKGGEYGGETLYLHQDGHTGGKGGVKELELGKHRLGKLPARKAMEVQRLLQQALANKIPLEHLPPDLLRIPGVQDAYSELGGGAESKGETHVKLPAGSHFQLIPTKDPKKREVWYIAGASGSGKSHIAKGIAEQYMKQFPDRDVYLVSKLEQDETLDSMKGRKCIRLKPAKLVEEPLKDLDLLKDSLIIFDDYDTFLGKEMKVIQQLIDDIAIMGRHNNITMLCLTHYLTNYSKTRLLLTEATHIVVYPLSTGAHALNYLLKTYLGLEKDEISAIRKGGSRWVCLYKNYPNYCVTETEAFLLHEDRKSGE